MADLFDAPMLRLLAGEVRSWGSPMPVAPLVTLPGWFVAVLAVLVLAAALRPLVELAEARQ